MNASPISDDDVFFGHVSAMALTGALLAYYYDEPRRAEHLERAKDELIKAANSIGCTVKAAPAHLVLMQKTETKIAMAMDRYANGVMARASKADHLQRELTKANAALADLTEQLRKHGRIAA